MFRKLALITLIAAALAALLVTSQLRPAPLKVSGVIEADEIRLGSRVGGRVHFDRPADSLNAAIASAVADLRACGLDVERIEIAPEDLAEITQATA